jgi:hypothetical protein
MPSRSASPTDCSSVGFCPSPAAGTREAGARRWLRAPPLETNPVHALASGLVLRGRGWRIAYLGAGAAIRRTRTLAAQIGADAVVLAAGEPAHFRGSRLALTRMAARHTVVITGPGADPEVGIAIPGALLRRDPVGAAIELDGIVFTPAG